MMIRIRRSLLSMVFGAAATGCMLPTESSSGLHAFVGLVPAMSQEAGEVYREIDDFGLRLNNVRVALTADDGSFLYDSTIAIAPGQDSIVLELIVPMTQARRTVSAHVELRDSALVVFSGAEMVELRRGGASSSTPMVVLDYTGPGALARGIDLNPRDTTIAPKSKIGFAAAARDAYGDALQNVPVSWTVSDPTAGSITAEGVFTPKGRGETWVIARLPTGLRDSAKVAVSTLK